MSESVFNSFFSDKRKMSAIPALSPRSPHLQGKGRLSRSPKAKSTNVAGKMFLLLETLYVMVHPTAIKEKEEAEKGTVEVPKITTADLAAMLHGDKSGPPSPVSMNSPKGQIPGTSPREGECCLLLFCFCSCNEFVFEILWVVLRCFHDGLKAKHQLLLLVLENK
jgi:hypothetical protein